MKKQNSLLILVAAIGLMSLMPACHSKTEDKTSAPQGEKKISHYTCPMHRQIHESHPGHCPICGMTLIPIYEEENINSSSSLPTVSISTERQQLIGVTFATAQIMPLTKEIHTLGRVAFDPELAVAQTEYLEILKNSPELKGAAGTRLRLMGMSEEEIKALGKNKKMDSSLYLPKTGDAIWIYAPIYENELSLVKSGSTALVTLPSSTETVSGTVRSLDPMIDPTTRSIKARIEMPNTEGKLKLGSVVDVTLKIDLGKSLAIPKTAIIDSGTRKTVFTVKNQTHFEAHEIKTGEEGNDTVAVIDGLKEGDVVATDAAFLIDSESQLNAAVDAMK